LVEETDAVGAGDGTRWLLTLQGRWSSHCKCFPTVAAVVGGGGSSAAADDLMVGGDGGAAGGDGDGGGWIDACSP